MREMEILEVRDLIYLAKHIGVPDVYKLGVTRCLKNRLSVMNSSSPYGVEVFAAEYTEYPRMIEDSLLEKWKNNRVNGEWLELNQSELELLKSEMKLLAEVVSVENLDYLSAQKAIHNAGYSVANHGNYKYKNNNAFKIIWKKSIGVN